MGSGNSVDLYDYIGKVLSNNPNCELHIGCDSQNHSRFTTYVTTIVFRFPGQGAHVIYYKEKIDRIADLWSKLWGELERSIHLANLVQHVLKIRVHQIDLDFNTNPNYPSYKVLSAATGYISSLGYQVKAKPELLMACWAANVLCN